MKRSNDNCCDFSTEPPTKQIKINVVEQSTINAVATDELNHYDEGEELFKEGIKYDNDSNVVFDISEDKLSDYSKAMEYYLKSAEQFNNPKAMFRIGRVYFMGKGVEIDYSKALEWYLKAANLNDSNAQYMIGEIY